MTVAVVAPTAVAEAVSFAGALTAAVATPTAMASRRELGLRGERRRGRSNGQRLSPSQQQGPPVPGGIKMAIAATHAPTPAGVSL